MVLAFYRGAISRTSCVILDVSKFGQHSSIENWRKRKNVNSYKRYVGRANLPYSTRATFHRFSLVHGDLVEIETVPRDPLAFVLPDHYYNFQLHRKTPLAKRQQEDFICYAILHSSLMVLPVTWCANVSHIHNFSSFSLNKACAPILTATFDAFVSPAFEISNFPSQFPDLELFRNYWWLI